MSDSKNKMLQVSSFILGAATGTVLSFLFATRGGKVFRQKVKNDTNLLYNNFFEEKNRLVKELKTKTDDGRKNIIETIANPVNDLLQELSSIKEGISTALIEYTRKRRTSPFYDLTHDFINDDLTDFETLPKKEGMRRREDHERYS